MKYDFESVIDRRGMDALAVDALGGRPGVHSARYCGVHGDDEANNQLLLKELQDVEDEKRTAQYVAAIALCSPGKEDIVVQGECRGRILREYRGEGGFGSTGKK